MSVISTGHPNICFMGTEGVKYFVDNLENEDVVWTSDVISSITTMDEFDVLIKQTFGKRLTANNTDKADFFLNRVMVSDFVMVTCHHTGLRLLSMLI